MADKQLPIPGLETVLPHPRRTKHNSGAVLHYKEIKELEARVTLLEAENARLQAELESGGKNHRP